MLPRAPLRDAAIAAAILYDAAAAMIISFDEPRFAAIDDAFDSFLHDDGNAAA